MPHYFLHKNIFISAHYQWTYILIPICLWQASSVVFDQSSLEFSEKRVIFRDLFPPLLLFSFLGAFFIMGMTSVHNTCALWSSRFSSLQLAPWNKPSYGFWQTSQLSFWLHFAFYGPDSHLFYLRRFTHIDWEIHLLISCEAHLSYIAHLQFGELVIQTWHTTT